VNEIKHNFEGLIPLVFSYTLGYKRQSLPNIILHVRSVKQYEWQWISPDDGTSTDASL